MTGEREATILNRVMLAVTQIGTRIFRNSVGLGWQGQIHRFSKIKQITVRAGDILISNPRALKSGLCNGSSDLIGWHTVTITEDMVMQKVAVFVAVETKSEQGFLSEEQSNFLGEVRNAGGIAIEARSAEETARAIQLWFEGHPF